MRSTEQLPIEPPATLPATMAPPLDDPLQRMTLMDFSEMEDDSEDQETSRAEALPSDQPDELDRAIDDLQKKPWRGSKQADQAPAEDPDSQAEPGFVKHVRRKERLGQSTRTTMKIAAFFLMAALFGQGVYAFRSQIAAHFPQTLPMLTQLCDTLSCRVELSAQINAVSIESHELQALAADSNMFALTTLLRNRSTTVQAWPNIELTLIDANQKQVARRVVTPHEYLPTPLDPNKGFAGNSEQVIRVAFDLSQLKASDYRVYLFYP